MGRKGLFLLARDLLDQQVIDVHGRKVVRVNDIDMLQESHQNRACSQGRVGGRGRPWRGAPSSEGRRPDGALRPFCSTSPRGYSLGLRGPDRDRPGPPGKAEDFA